ncbi:MAG: hypothetical protein J7M19_03015 [Planctomycetes bacterium]|nr:hypothetical protein [Planctomycetota bacterium]
MSLGVDLFWPAWAAAVFVLAALGVHVLAYRRTSRPISPAARRFFLAIRLAAVALLVFVLWRPAAQREETLEAKGRLVLLVDASKSMSIGDETSGEKQASCSRLARAAGIFPQNRDLWRQITAGWDVLPYSFAGEIRPLPVAADELDSRMTFGIGAAGEVTALGDVLGSVTSAAAAPQAILIVSDGLSNSGVEPLDSLVPGGPAIYTVSVGRSEPGESTRDISAVGIFAPAEAFQGGEVPVLAQFGLTGLAGRSVRVWFLADGREVTSREITTGRSRDVVEARFTFRPDETGPVRLEVRADPLPDEIVSVNNQASTFTDVKKGETKVLYFEGSFRWEAKFIKAALEAAGDIEMRLVIPRAGAVGEVREALAKDWDVLIIGSIPAETFGSEALSAVEKAVSRGKGVLFLGGPSGLGRGGYAKSPAAALVAFEISRDEQTDGGLYSVHPRPLGPHADLIMPDPEEDMSAWEAVSPLLALNIVGPPRPGASVLLEAEPVILDKRTGALSRDTSRTRVPLFAVEEYGKGRTGAFAGTGTWRWATGGGVPEGKSRDIAAWLQRWFWRQTVFWLAKREERGGMTVNLHLPRHRVALGEPIEMHAEVLDEELKPLTDVELAVRIAHNGHEETRTFWVEGNGYGVDFEPGEAGDYGMRVTAKRGGRKLADAKSAFVVTAEDVEFTTLVARPGLLAALSKATGGSFATADNARRVLSDIAAAARSSRHRRLKRTQLWSSYWYLGAILVLLTLEWILRKPAGLV